MERYEKCCYNCKHVTLESCKGCNTFGDTRFQNFELRDELSKLESGKLVELPCKVGDTIWVVDKFLNWQLCEGVIEAIEINKYTNPKIWIAYKYSLSGIGELSKSNRIDLLKNVFFDKAEAEAKLKELQG